jgi:hypothetical protein
MTSISLDLRFPNMNKINPKMAKMACSAMDLEWGSMSQIYAEKKALQIGTEENLFTEEDGKLNTFKYSTSEIMDWIESRAHTPILKINLKICAMVDTTYTCTNPDSLNETFPDIYFPNIEGCEDKEDLGANDHHYSVNGKDEMVFVDKGLLEALVDQCQRLSSNAAVYDDTRGQSFEYANLNKLVMGMQFPESVIGTAAE